MVHWHSSWAFLLFLPIGLLFLWLWARRRERQPRLTVSSIIFFRDIPRGWRAQMAFLPRLLHAIGLILAVVALARPQMSDTRVKKSVEGIDIVLTLDVSDSMLIEDMLPENRLEASKKTIREFIEKRATDRIGLVVFSGEAYTRVPLTLDYPLLVRNLTDVKTSRNVKMGTAIGVALANAVARLKDSTARSRVVIFLTDGENNSGTIDPLTALEIAKQYGIKVYSIGMGVDGEAQLPVYIEGPGGQRIKQYRPLHSKINEELLTQMATETGGRFFRATTSKALDGVFDEINRLEKTKTEMSEFTKYSELYSTYLMPAVVLFFLSLFLNFFVFGRVP